MKFFISILVIGALMVALPVFASMHYNHELTRLASIVVNSNGSASLPDQPVVWYAASATVGGILIAVAVISGLLKEFSKN